MNPQKDKIMCYEAAFRLGRRIAFLAVVTLIAFLEGFYLGPLGFDWLIGSVVITTVLAIGWMRSYWECVRARVSPSFPLPRSLPEDKADYFTQHVLVFLLCQLHIAQKFSQVLTSSPQAFGAFV
jgi:hypothetical protein